MALVIEHRLGSSSSEKNLTTLLTELKQINEKLDIDQLRTTYKQIELIYQSQSSLLIKKKSIQQWMKSDIKEWSQLVCQCSTSTRPSLAEMLAIIKRAVYLDSNFEPRPIQILTIIIVLDPNHHGGRLLQILTGEGKSTIVSMLAVIKALENQHVDIITSSMTLAKRDAHEKEQFYDFFDLKVAHNNDETSYVSGPKACYRANIVYGNSSQFQFDLLCHEFSLLNTR